MSVAERPTTTADAGGWSESPDQSPEAPVTAPQTGTNGADATGATLAAEEPTAANEPPRRPDGRFEKNGFARHRAQKDLARKEDVPRIQELTLKLRQTERERDALKNGWAPPGPARPTPEGAPGTGPAPPASAPPHPAAAPPAPRRGLPPPPPPFTLQKPTFEDFKDSADPLVDHTEAVAEFVYAKRQHELATRYHAQESKKVVEASDQEFRGATEAHWQRMNDAAADPANKELMERFRHDNRPITPAILEAIVRTGADSAKLTLALLRREGLLEELTLATYDRPATPDLVALVQRRLQSLGPLTAATGSAAAPVVRPAPRPPNPVRTAPDAPPRDLPGDDASLADHAAAFHQPRRSRLRRD